MIFLSVTFKLVASEDRRRTNSLRDVLCSDSDNCSKRRFCEAIFEPVMIKAAGILSNLDHVIS